MKDYFYTPEQLLSRMNLQKCDVCDGKLNYYCDGVYKCERCSKEFLDDCGKVKEYLYEHGNSTITEISRATGVSRQSVYNLLRFCKMEILEPAVSYLHCEICGAQLKNGQICSDCAKNLQGKLLKEEDAVRLANVGNKPRSFSQNPDYSKIKYEPISKFRQVNSKKTNLVKSQDNDSKLVKDLDDKRKNF